MDTLAAISRWLGSMSTWCVASDGELWCANAFYVYDSQNVAFYLLSDDNTRHGQMTGLRAKVAGTVNGQPKTVARFAASSSKVKFVVFRRRGSGDARAVRQPLSDRQDAAAPVWEIRPDELKFTDNTLGFGTKLHWLRHPDSE
jgi:uncharacterized protein YhbP (UPF0306 family)